MFALLQVVASVFEFFNKIATRLREIRIRRAIKREITNEAKENIANAKKSVKEKLRAKYGILPDDTTDKP